MLTIISDLRLKRVEKEHVCTLLFINACIKYALSVMVLSNGARVIVRLVYNLQ